MTLKEKPEGDFISRKAIKTELGKLDTWAALDEIGEEHECVDALEVDDLIDFAPSVDAVEVVRCEECKHRDPEDKKCDAFVMFKYPFSVANDDFCSCGERKEVDT